MSNVISDADAYAHQQQLREWLATFGDAFPENFKSVLHQYNVAHLEVAWRARLQARRLFAALWGGGPSQPAGAIEPGNVLVLYNADDGPDGPGAQIADYYQQLRPGVHVAGISGVAPILFGPTDEYVNAEDVRWQQLCRSIWRSWRGWL